VIESAVLEAFATRWTALHGLFVDARTDTRGWATALATLHEEASAPTTIVVWHDPALPADPIRSAALALGMVVVDVAPGSGGLVDGEGRPWTRDRLRDVIAASDIGVTSGRWAVAHTGSVAVYGTPDLGLWPSLLPPAHLITLRAEDIVATLAEGLRRLHEERPFPHEVKLVSGPSSTADIEGQLVVGVHGPKRVAVVLWGS
jgi:hypothetical protein